jgi:hypothetical protein
MLWCDAGCHVHCRTPLLHIRHCAYRRHSFCCISCSWLRVLGPRSLRARGGGGGGACALLLLLYARHNQSSRPDVKRPHLLVSSAKSTAHVLRPQPAPPLAAPNIHRAAPHEHLCNAKPSAPARCHHALPRAVTVMHRRAVRLLSCYHHHLRALLSAPSTSHLRPSTSILHDAHPFTVSSRRATHILHHRPRRPSPPPSPITVTVALPPSVGLPPRVAPRPLPDLSVQTPSLPASLLRH